jgi:phosphocarrier protein HPr
MQPSGMATVNQVTVSISSSRPLDQGVGAMQAGPLQRKVVIANPQGFHVRPATVFVTRAGQFQSQVAVIKGDLRVDGRRAFELLLLDAGPGTELILEVAGPDASEALEALAQVLEAKEPPPVESEPPVPKKG